VSFFAVLFCTGGFGLLSAFTPSSALWGFIWLVLSRGIVGIGVGGTSPSFLLKFAYFFATMKVVM